MRALLCILLLVLTVSVQANSVAPGWHRVSTDIARASLTSQVDVVELATFAAIESSFRTAVRNDRSTATGLFQFTNRTWRVTVQRYGNQFGLDKSARRHVAYDNAVMGAAYIEENRGILRQRLGREPRLVEVYLAHLMSPRRAVAIARMPRHAIMADQYPHLAAVNTRLFYRDGRARNVAQFMQVLQSKIDTARHTYGPLAREALARYIDQQEERTRWLAELRIAMQSQCQPAVLSNPEVEVTALSQLVISTVHVTCALYTPGGPGAPNWEFQDAVIRDRRLAA